MTRARALKHAIRARARKTGERYTTARRHVLKEIGQRPGSIAPASRAPVPTPRPAAIATAKGSVSPARVLEKTGHPLDYWFDVLDRFGAVEKGHTAAARHLSDAHRVGGWYAQGITVAFERTRGVRAVNQRCDGEFEVSVSKVLAIDTPSLIKAFTDGRQRRRWAGAAGAGLGGALGAALDSSASRGFVVRPDGQGRFRFKWDGTTVQLYLLPRPGGKVSLVATNTKLAGLPMVDERRAQWRAAFKALASMLAA